MLTQSLVDALSLGSLYALACLGIALSFGVMRLVNFAHGDIIALGAYSLIYPSAASSAQLFAGKLPLIVLLPLVMLFAGIAAITTERLAFRPLRGADPATLLISSFAVSYLIQQIIRSIYGSEPKSVGVGEALNRTLTFLGVRTSIIDVVIIGVTAVLLGALAAFLSRTTMGLQVRAASEDFVMARLLGIRANRVISIAFFIGGALGGAVSVLYVIKTGGLEPTMGVNLVLFAFVAVILGGMGSLWGAVGGAYLLGMVSVALQVALPIGLRGARDAFLFFIIVIILRLRPHGLFRGVAAGERV